MSLPVAQAGKASEQGRENDDEFFEIACQINNECNKRTPN
jgi:hypothetical protein